MTNQEAITIIDCERPYANCGCGADDEEIEEAFDMAIDMVIKALEQEPSGETVSLEAFKQVMWERDIAIEQLKELGYGFGQKIEPKTGHWIEKDGYDGDTYYDCSECGESWTTIDGTPWNNGMKYCPNCGCRMVEPQESEDKE